MTQLNELDLLNSPLICTWLQLKKAFEPLHQGEQAEIDRLHDVWTNSQPAPDWTVARPGQSFDERRPMQGDHFSMVINPIALITWIKEISAKRGFPYNEGQALSLYEGKERYI